MQQSLLKLEKDFKEATQERDKALQQLNRLKQHLLEKVSLCLHFLLYNYEVVRLKMVKSFIILV